MTGYRLLVRPEGYRPRPDSSAYAQYVKTMHAWAAELNVLPEVIEYLPLGRGRELPTLGKMHSTQHAQDFP